MSAPLGAALAAARTLRGRAFELRAIPGSDPIRIVRVRVGKRHMVARVFASATGNDARRERQVLEVISGLDFAPEVVETADQWMLMVDHGAAWSIETAQSDDAVQTVARIFDELHALPHGGMQPVSAARLLQAYKNDPGYSEYADLLDHLDGIDHGFPAGLCHMDPHHGNFVGEVAAPRLIDWDYAAVAPVWMDLFQYAVCNHLDANSEARLIECYTEDSDLRGQLMVHRGLFRRVVTALNDLWQRRHQ